MFDRLRYGFWYMMGVTKWAVATVAAFGVLAGTLLAAKLTHGSMQVGLLVGMLLGIALGFIILMVNYPVYTQSGDSEI